ncbi:MAG TPA: hypothetical protein VLF20_02750 [Patescibacteria group bacterium]|nr:hypothetical protein [Patescibacteria group bacterium]
MSQAAYKPHYEHLKNKWLDQQKELQKGLVEKHKDAFDWIKNTAKHFAVGSLGSLVLLTHPVTTSVISQQLHSPMQKKQVAFADTLSQDAFTPKTKLILSLSDVLPEDVRELTIEQEEKIGGILSQQFGMNISAELDGKKLNRSYGIIGAEQHLMRYPGDTMASHFQTAEEANTFYSSGMAPGRGAWGYFAQSAGAMTQQDIDREKYYIAVQTFLAPGFQENVREHYAFYKYRKMLVVNPENGKAVVAVIGDAGPAAWTGKHLGGSPEVMIHLERKDGRARGSVLYFFIDDPDDTIPLGPVEPKTLYAKT